MTRSELFVQIQKKESYLCIGLDPDLDKLPRHLLKSTDPVFEFNKQIIDATHEYCVAYKPNAAFYEALGAKGWESLQKTLDYIPKDIFTIADAKRGDLANTAIYYARAFFKTMDFDAVTLSPYMGADSLQPFLEFKEKWVILLVHTSNPGSEDFQTLELKSGRKLYEEVILRSQQWAGPDQLMYVVGATHADKIGEIRELAPDHFFLIPGVGAQGGDLEMVSKFGMTRQCGLLVNSSRSVIYASAKEDFAEQARKAAQELKGEMSRHLNQFIPRS
jgi:orotidine-5'-phosphate decarboxylase